MYIRTLIQAINRKEIEIEIVKQLSVLHSVCELAINLAFAQAPKQFDANQPSAVILLHSNAPTEKTVGRFRGKKSLLNYWMTRSHFTFCSFQFTLWNAQGVGITVCDIRLIR